MKSAIIALVVTLLGTGCAMQPEQSRADTKQTATAPCNPCEAFDQCVVNGRAKSNLSCSSDGTNSYCSCDSVAGDGVTPTHAECVINGA